MLENLTGEQAGLWAQVVALWDMAVRRDVISIANALHPAYSGWVTGNERPHDFQAAMASVGPPSPPIRRYDLTPLHVAVFDGVAGVAHYTYEAEVDSGGDRIQSIAGRWTEMYLRKNGAWQMVSVSGGPDGQR
nr:nuclear transport factor 2 family protein [Mesorhizobium sp.]